MHKSAQEFSCIIPLKRKPEQYKFVVDGLWRLDTDSPTRPDASNVSLPRPPARSIVTCAAAAEHEQRD